MTAEALGDLYLGLDVGTQSTKAVLLDLVAGRVVGRGSHSYGLLEGLSEGHMEQHPRIWVEAVIEAVGRALDDATETAGAYSREAIAALVRGVGVSGQQHGAVLLDEHHQPTRAAKLWCDTSTALEARELSHELGRAIPAGFTAPKLRYTARHEPAIWNRTRWTVLPHDFVNLWLTGEIFTEPGDASGTGYSRADGRGYIDELDAIAPGLSERVPSILPSAEVAASLRSSAAEALGLTAGLPVSGGGGDNMMSAIGSGAVTPGAVTCSLGTSGTIFAYSDQLVADPGGAVAAFRPSSDGPEALGHLPLLCVMNCTGVLAQVLEITGRTHAELTLLAESVPFGSDGMLFVPFVAGERVPDLPNARGQLLRVGTSFSAGSLYRAALEGISANLSLGLDRMRHAGLSVNEVRLVGGAAGNPLWQSLLSTLFGCPVRLVAETETAAVGAGLQAAAAATGERLATITESFVSLVGDPIEPSATDGAAARELVDRFREVVAGL